MRSPDLPRVPALGRARLLFWAGAGLVAIAGALAPGGSEPVGPRSVAGVCRLDAVSAGPPCACAEVPARVRVLLGWPLDLNRVPAPQLEWLPGVGPARAAAIAAGRPYARLAELERVPGIGPATRRALEPHLYTGADPACPWPEAPVAADSPGLDGRG